MCGISGVVGKISSADYVRRMALALSHRGPDNLSVWHEDDVGLGHNRLSIVDLSEAGNQPFIDATTGIVMVANGEIYNHIELRKELEVT